MQLMDELQYLFVDYVGWIELTIETVDHVLRR